MSQFNPRRVLRQISPPLLKEFFERQKQPLDVKWDDLSNAKVDDIFDAWQRLPDGPRKDIEMVFHDIDEIAKGDEGLKVIHEESLCHGENLAVLLEPMESRYDRAMWTCLNRPQVWDAAVRFAKADSLSLGRFWIKRGSVPKAEPRTDDDGRRELADAMSAFFREQGRGHYCRVDHFPRGRLLRISQDAECDGKRSKGSSSRGRCCGAFRFCARGRQRRPRGGSVTPEN